MTRSDLLIKLVKAGSSGDKVMFKSTVEAIIAEERSKKHHILADRLTEVIQTRFVSQTSVVQQDEKISSLVSERSPRRVLDDLMIPVRVRRECEDLVEEQMRGELLRSYSLEPRNRVLLTGPPGNGKMSLAEAIASAMMVPFFVVRYEGIIGSYLGETSMRLQRE